MIRLADPRFGDAEIQAATRVLRSGYLVQGPQVQRFEALVAQAAETRHAVAVSSGTAALHLALLALDVGPGDEVIVPDFSFPATANSVEITGARAVLADVDSDTFNVTADTVARAITPRTKVIMPVHAFGLPVDMDALSTLATSHGIKVVEDAACALGARWRSRACGSFGVMAAFSFHPRKIVTTGEGGAVTTDDAALADRLRTLRNHGQASRDGTTEFVAAGFNYRLTEFQGAIGVVQMARLREALRHRADVAAQYTRELSGLSGVRLPTVPSGAEPAWQSYVLRVPADVRNALRARLFARGVETSIGTWSASTQPRYRGYSNPLPPRSLEVFEATLALPLHEGIGPAEVSEVTQAVAVSLAEVQASTRA